MSQQKSTLVSEFEPNHISLSSYVTGFVTCIALTIVAYFVAVDKSLSNQSALIVVTVLAVVQCAVQLRRFLHLGDEFKPRIKLLVFGIMLTMILIIVGGSVWIMNNLNYRMINSPSKMQEYINSQDGL